MGGGSLENLHQILHFLCWKIKDLRGGACSPVVAQTHVINDATKAQAQFASHKVLLVPYS